MSLPPTCRYAALPHVRMSITDSGRMAMSGQSHMATAGQTPMSAHDPGFTSNCVIAPIGRLPNSGTIHFFRSLARRFRVPAARSTVVSFQRSAHSDKLILPEASGTNDPSVISVSVRLTQALASRWVLNVFDRVRPVGDITRPFHPKSVCSSHDFTLSVDGTYSFYG